VTATPFAPETGRKEKKILSNSGNETVFRGSFQLSRLIFPGEGKRLEAVAESGLFAKSTEFV
jgi:hypothetical protein